MAADPDGRQAAHLDTGIQGMTVTEPAMVARAVNLFDTLPAGTLSYSDARQQYAGIDLPCTPVGQYR